MSKELEIKFHSGATISFIGEDSGESLKGFDNTKILQALEEYNNTDHGEDFEEFDLFEKQPKMKKQYSSKQRKLHKLKRENVVLGQKRSELFYRILSYRVNNLSYDRHISLNRELCDLSQRIGKNSAKIQRLRTQIQQEKALDKL